MIRHWRYLQTGYNRGSHNMALDEVLLRSVQICHHTAAVRVYGWRPRAISVGYGQDVLQDIDVEKCIRTRTDIVRRLTGGRAVLHDEEVTYSVVAPGDDPVIGGNVSETYRRIGQALICGLTHLGVQADMHRSAATGARSPSCFSSTGRYEVMLQGRKIIGSAQRRIGAAILQHGSLLTGPGYRSLAEFLRPDTSSPRCERWRDSVTTLSEILSKRPSLRQVSEALRWGFEETFGVQLVEDTLTEDEHRMAAELMDERYGRDEWNLQRCPFFY